MHIKLEDILKRAFAEGLTHEERERMRAVLAEYMKHKPIRSFASRHTKKPFLVRLFASPAFAGLLVALLVSGGVSYAAEGALPGEPLYAIKVGITEPLVRVAAPTSELRAKAEQRFAERRIREAEKLIAQDTFSEERRVELENRIAAHIERLEERLARVRAKNPARAEALEDDLERRLNERLETLERRFEKSEAQRMSASPDGAGEPHAELEGNFERERSEEVEYEDEEKGFHVSPRETREKRPVGERIRSIFEGGHSTPTLEGGAVMQSLSSSTDASFKKPLERVREGFREAEREEVRDVLRERRERTENFLQEHKSEAEEDSVGR